jgi:hypothetical protein
MSLSTDEKLNGYTSNIGEVMADNLLNEYEDLINSVEQLKGIDRVSLDEFDRWAEEMLRDDPYSN